MDIVDAVDARATVKGREHDNGEKLPIVNPLGQGLVMVLDRDR
ncbi:hypothetical protein [Streptomyces sp. NBC_00280]